MTEAADIGNPDRKRVGFIGLGHMGSAMARRLVEAGYDVTVWSRTAAHVDELAADGATRADSPALRRSSNSAWTSSSSKRGRTSPAAGRKASIESLSP